MKKQIYRIIFYNLDANTFNERFVYAFDQEDAQKFAKSICMKEQKIKSVDKFTLNLFSKSCEKRLTNKTK